MANRLKEKYLNEVVPALTEKFNYSSVMAVPKVDKIVLNMGVGDAVSNAKNLEKAAEELALISGQKPLITKAKKSIAGFRLREGVAIGAKVTLRGERMYEFLDKLVDMMEFLIPKYSKEGKTNLVIGIGCTGGKHRSVAIAQALTEKLEGNGEKVYVSHRDQKFW